MNTPPGPPLRSFLQDPIIFLFEPSGSTPIGTAFVIGYPVPGHPDRSVPLLVTAKHVLGDLPLVFGRFSRQPDVPTNFPPFMRYLLADLRESGDLWEHPDPGVDITVFRTVAPNEYRMPPLHAQSIASRKTFDEEEIGLLNRVAIPGLLTNFTGELANYPVVRDGTIAVIPDEPVPLSIRVGASLIQTHQHVLLINAVAALGASGSPVYLWPDTRVRNGRFQTGGRMYLIGVIHGFYNANPRSGVPMDAATHAWGFMENSGIAVAMPSWRILEILDLPALRARMQRIIDQFLASLPPQESPEASADPNSPSPT